VPLRTSLAHKRDVHGFCRSARAGKHTLEVFVNHSDLSRINGYSLNLRLIRPEDAAYIHQLRNEPTRNRYLSEVRGTIDDQRRWIDAYIARETAGSELYYMIERSNGERCGTVRLYDIQSNSFTWGSWVLDHNKPRMAALESAILSFRAGFLGLGLEHARVEVLSRNSHAQAFYRRLGMKETHRTELETVFGYTRERFNQDYASHMTLCEKEVSA
jgi:RimJ/RimL family protein N-acetyltransferase